MNKKKKKVNTLLYVFNPLHRYIYVLVINFRSGIITDLIRSAPSLPLWKCLGYFVLLAFGIELLVGAPPPPPFFFFYCMPV